MNIETKGPADMEPQGRERIDLAVYAYRVLAVLRPLDPRECDVVLHAALELNRASPLRRPPASPPDEPVQDES